MTIRFSERMAGVLVPLFSLRSAHDWGVGEIPDVTELARWLSASGHSVLQLLPIGEPAMGQNSPYSSFSAFAIDPLYLRLEEVEDFCAAGGVASLSQTARAHLEEARQSPRVAYDLVRPLKERALQIAFAHFYMHEWATSSARAAELQRFCQENQYWLEDCALFRVLHLKHGTSWESWRPPLRERQPKAIAATRRVLQREILFYQFVQWHADRQWQQARRAAAAWGVRLKGDLPFMVARDSADVWVRQTELLLDAHVGAPPDAFSATGQDWGLPPYHWEVMARNDYEWLRQRAGRSAALFDYYRIDHVVGFYRTYILPRSGARPHFIPAEEADQLALGETILRIFQAGAARRVVAEDLGTVPDFVRESLTRLGIPGYRVFRWEREWHQEGQPFRDPRNYPPLSVATSGTHDTETLAVWWDEMEEEQSEVLKLPALAHLREAEVRRFNPIVQQALLDLLYGAGSDLVILPIQDLFGMRDRINTPGTTHAENWTYRLPWEIHQLESDPQLKEQTASLWQRATRHDRILSQPAGSG
ncbi:MAG: 4-alpha-glucanotransferase [Candidatus Tectomicrobia bacterium]|uniref:4-alpha-glucanotransferase n=1 Tax=Tectimicrobiota bacterium TaxID=2528274 RepID=A0A932CR67_UNCTE|nr:4-alpha-glucanotransferase [Candidatus Tectomicrobia bacterium]